MLNDPSKPCWTYKLWNTPPKQNNTELISYIQLVSQFFSLAFYPRPDLIVRAPTCSYNSCLALLPLPQLFSINSSTASANMTITKIHARSVYDSRVGVFHRQVSIRL